MAPSDRRGTAHISEVAFSQLRSCLVNLPSALSNVLADANILAQSIVVEISWQPSAGLAKKDGSPAPKSIYAGWTGYDSKRKAEAPTAHRNRGRELDLVEIDSLFAQLVGLKDRQQVGILLHTEPPLAHTISIEPLTAADWEVIELNAEFLETNCLAQLRAVPNPSYKSSNAHPLTLHLSPTSTANVLATQLKPAPPADSPFAKVSGNDVEVIVAPKARQTSANTQDIPGATASSVSGRSRAGSASRSSKTVARPATFLRGIDRKIASEWFDDEVEAERNEGLRAWVDAEILNSRDLHGFTWAWIMVVRPSGLKGDAEENTESIKPAMRVVAELIPWDDSPNQRHIALSSQLCHALDTRDMVGELISVEAAPPQVSKTAARSLRVYPFAPEDNKEPNGIRFGGKTRNDALESAQLLYRMYSSGLSGDILSGPITDGMVLSPPKGQEDQVSWRGGIVKFYPPSPPIDAAKSTRGWLLGSDRRIVVSTAGETPRAGSNDRRLTLEVMAETMKQPLPGTRWRIGEPLHAVPPSLVGIEALLDQISAHLRRGSSTLLTGAVGAGKTSIAQVIAHAARAERLTHVLYFPSQTSIAADMRTSKVKEILGRLFDLASWRAQMGGNSLVILDDLDSLCPAENELETGSDERNRLISEIVRGTVEQHCAHGSRVVLLAIAQNKEALHKNIVGGHVVSEMVHLSAPSKDLRRQVLEHIVRRAPSGETPMALTNGDITSDLDFLDIAGRTDGYMPSDLELLVSRARTQMLIRNTNSSYCSMEPSLTMQDFNKALEGFTPSSLRNVTLQHSTISFSSVGGLRSTKQTLMETLQYPTLYSPIFAKCPLRLRSGLLLYGHPGCGKTLLASAVAGECGLNFISVKGPEILNKYIGASEKSIRDLFERAQSARPSVLFFDEFDSVAPKRGHDSTGVTDRVVNQLLTQMDGAEGLSGVYVLAATSRPDLIDPALLRPGRLDKSLFCSMPSIEDREDILLAMSSNIKISQHTKSQMRLVAQRTDGYTGADLQAVIYNAHLEAIHDLLDKHSDNDNAHRMINGTSKRRESGTRSSEPPEFHYFKLGDDNRNSNTTPQSASSKASERAQIAQLLLRYRTMEKRARALRRGQGSDGAGARGDGQDHKEADREPVVEWSHLERSLAQTKASISLDEVRRLDRIYGEFVASRSGEMPSGQGGSEIGGRSSLM